MSKGSTLAWKETDQDMPCTVRLKQHLEEKFGSASAGLAAMAAVVGTPLTFRSFCDALDAVGADFQSCRADLFRRLSGEDGDLAFDQSWSIFPQEGTDDTASFASRSPQPHAQPVPDACAQSLLAAACTRVATPQPAADVDRWRARCLDAERGLAARQAASCSTAEQNPDRSSTRSLKVRLALNRIVARFVQARAEAIAHACMLAWRTLLVPRRDAELTALRDHAWHQGERLAMVEGQLAAMKPLRSPLDEKADDARYMEHALQCLEAVPWSGELAHANLLTLARRRTVAIAFAAWHRGWCSTTGRGLWGLILPRDRREIRRCLSPSTPLSAVSSIPRCGSPFVG